MGLTFHEESWVIIFLTNILMPKKDSKYTQSVDDLFTIVTMVKKNCPWEQFQFSSSCGTTRDCSGFVLFCAVTVPENLRHFLSREALRF